MSNEQQTTIAASVPAPAPTAATTVAAPGVPVMMMTVPNTSHEEDTNLSTRIAYFAIGSAVGAIVALLFAPKPGRELRTDIADATRKGVDRTRDAAHTVGTKAGEYYEVSRERAAVAYNVASHKAGEVARTAREGAARHGEQLSAAIEAGKQAYTEEKRRTETFDKIEGAPTYYDAESST